MIKIALCDDNEVERRLLRKIVTAVLQELHQEVLIVEFSSGEKLQRNFSRGDYDLIFYSCAAIIIAGMICFLRETVSCKMICFVSSGR